MVSLDFLEKVEVFKDFNDNQLSALQKCGSVLEFQRGDRLFAEGEDSKHLWIVEEGQVGLRFDTQEGRTSEKDKVSFISELQTFGWSCFVPPNTYSLSGYCESRQCKVVAMEKEKLIKLFEDDSEIGYGVMFYLVCVVGSHFHRFQDELAKQMGHDIMSNW